MEKIIKIKEGYGPLRFGITQEIAQQMLGAPTATQTMDNADGTKAHVLSYDDETLTLFFNNNGILTEIDVDNNEETTLFDRPVFDMNKKEIMMLMKEHGFNGEQDTLIDDDCISYEDANIDFYFYDDTLDGVFMYI